MRKLLLAVLVLGILSLPLIAQDSPKVEIFGGYQYLHTGDITVQGTTAIQSQGHNGWDISPRVNFGRHFGVEGDFGGTYSSFIPPGGSTSINWHNYTFTGGPVVFYDAGGKINPFVHVLFGGIHTSLSASGVSITKTGFTTLFGGGIDVKANRAISIRLIEADWLYYHFGDFQPLTSSSISQSNNVRITTGIVFTF
jgi:hypothetical protein